MIYAGVGARNTPENVLQEMTKIAEILANDKWLLRSGGAVGADTAFFNGCNKVKGNMEIFYPNVDIINEPKFEEAKAIAKSYHGNWKATTSYAKRCLTRNVYILLGPELDTPADVCIYWRNPNTKYGGTLHTITMAKDNNIFLLDMNIHDTPDKIHKIIKEYYS
jgi:hypothetical protein